MLLDCTPVRFRQLWSSARRRLKIPAEFTGYGLRRGGATDVTTALQDASMQEFAAHNSLWERWCRQLVAAASVKRGRLEGVQTRTRASFMSFNLDASFFSVERVSNTRADGPSAILPM